MKSVGARLGCVGVRPGASIGEAGAAPLRPQEAPGAAALASVRSSGVQDASCVLSRHDRSLLLVHCFSFDHGERLRLKLLTSTHSRHCTLSDEQVGFS